MTTHNIYSDIKISYILITLLPRAVSDKTLHYHNIIREVGNISAINHVKTVMHQNDAMSKEKTNKQNKIIIIIIKTSRLKYRKVL